MATAKVEALVEKARQAWLTDNGDAFAALFTDDGELIAPGNRWVGYRQIYQAVMDYAAAYDQLEIALHRIVQDGDQVVIEWSWRDRNQATGELAHAEDAIVVDLEQNRIRRWREYIDVVDTQ